MIRFKSIYPLRKIMVSLVLLKDLKGVKSGINTCTAMNLTILN